MIDLAKTLAEVERETLIGVRDIRSGDRSTPIVTARWTVWRRLHESGANLRQIALAWGCDPTTVLHAKQSGWRPSDMGPTR